MKIRITCNAEVGVNATGYTACAHQSPDGGSWEPVLDSTRRPIELAHSSEEGARERVAGSPPTCRIQAWRVRIGRLRPSRAQRAGNGRGSEHARQDHQQWARERDRGT